MCLNQDDGPRDKASEPEATPIAVHIHNLLIHRQDDGSFSIGRGYLCPLLLVYPFLLPFSLLIYNSSLERFPLFKSLWHACTLSFTLKFASILNYFEIGLKLRNARSKCIPPLSPLGQLNALRTQSFRRRGM